MNRPELLGIYLNDHLAGSTGGVETARRARGPTKAPSSGRRSHALCVRSEPTARRSSGDGGTRRRPLAVKPAIGWLGEKPGG